MIRFDEVFFYSVLAFGGLRSIRWMNRCECQMSCGVIIVFFFTKCEMSKEPNRVGLGRNEGRISFLVCMALGVYI